MTIDRKQTFRLDIETLKNGPHIASHNKKCGDNNTWKILQISFWTFWLKNITEEVKAFYFKENVVKGSILMLAAIPVLGRNSYNNPDDV